jgi:Holliday junction resolvasome RuvABC endonuclease subunit
MNKWLIGIDAGFRNVGMVAFNSQLDIIDFCYIETKPFGKKYNVYVSTQDIFRVRKIVREMREFYESVVSVGEDTVLVSCELSTGGSQGARANRCMGMATAIMVTFLEIYGALTVWPTPGDVKKVLTGNKNAAKKIVQEAVIRKYPQFIGTKQIGFEHIADAVCAAEWAKTQEAFKYTIGV